MIIYRNLGGGGHLCTCMSGRVMCIMYMHEWESDVHYGIYVHA